MTWRWRVFLTCALGTTAWLGAFAGQAQGADGQISGRVLDVRTGQALPGANVWLEGTQLGAAADAQGRFRIQHVPAGRYALHASVIGYRNAVLRDVQVPAGGGVELVIRLRPAVVQLEPVVVRKTGEGYEVLNGHRRVAVARATGRADVAAEVVEIADEEAPLMPYLLNAPESFDEIEIALFLRRLVKEHGMDEATIAEKTGLRPEEYKELFFDPREAPLTAFNAHFEGLLKRYFRIVRGELDIEKNGVRLRLEVDGDDADDATKAEIYRCIWRLSRM